MSITANNTIGDYSQERNHQMATTFLERPKTHSAAPAREPRFSRLTKADILDTRGLDSDYYEITPDLAAWILETRNPTNRRLKAQKLEQLSDDIINGRFMVNGESIIFDWDGNVIDAQHRLTGCVRTGRSIVSLVAFGVDPAARVTVDQGSVRTTGDALQIKGTPYGNLVASIAKLIISYQRSDGGSLGRPHAVSRGAIDEYVESHPDIVEIAKYGDHYQARRILRPTVAGFCFWLLGTQYGIDVADDYLSKVSTGEGLKLGDGALAARNRLISETDTTQPLRVEIILRGFAYHYTGKHCARIQLMGNFPKLPSPQKAAA